MTRIICITYTLIFFFTLESFGQKENRIWYFGGHYTVPATPGAGLDFNSGTPIPLLNSAMGYTEGSAVQCDRKGNLLFYTNGMTVWNKNHAIMMNGTGVGGHSSSEQSAVIIPFPSYNDTNKFYLFANDGFPTSPGTGLHYSIIDMSLNGGLGAVTAVKAIPLLPATGEWLNASQHSNGKDFWVVTVDFDSTIFHSYLVSDSGISLPVKTNLGYNSSANFKLDFNNKGDRITFKRLHANTNQCSRMLAEFDQATGVIINPLSLDTVVFSNDGAGFSPNDSLFYYFKHIGSQPHDLRLLQYDLYATNLYSSGQTIMQFNTYPHLDMKNGPDGKLYVSNATTDSLDVIVNPNERGIACMFQTNAIYLGGKQYRFVLPNRTFELAKPIVPVASDEIVSEKLSVYPNPASTHFYLKTNMMFNGYSIYNINGQLMQEESFNQLKDVEFINVQLTKGVYILKVNDEHQGLYYSKVVIN